MVAFGTHELEAKLGLVRENYEFGFRPVAFKALAGCPRGRVELATGKRGLLVGSLGRGQNLRACLRFWGQEERLG